MKIVVSPNRNTWTGILLNANKLYYSAYSFKSKEEAIFKLSTIAQRKVTGVEEKKHPYLEAINGIVNGTNFKLPKIDFDFSGYTENEITVLKTLLEVPAGEVVSYGELGKRAGFSNGAGQFIGNVMMKNRFGPIIPCHRVILANGKLGKFAGKANNPRKRQLLSQEGAKFKE